MNTPDGLWTVSSRFDTESTVVCPASKGLDPVGLGLGPVSLGPGPAGLGPGPTGPGPAGPVPGPRKGSGTCRTRRTHMGPVRQKKVELFNPYGTQSIAL